MSTDSRSRGEMGRIIGVFVIGVIVLAGTGLFGIQYHHERTADAVARNLEAAQLLDLARRAQVSFKVQVQEWKNVLLRGRTAEELNERRTLFEHQSKAVGHELAALAAARGLSTAKKREVESLSEEHRRLDGLYRAALAAYVPTQSETIFAVDNKVRGIDRGLNDRIDALADEILQTSQRQAEELRERGEREYQTLRTVISSVAAAVIVLSGILAWLALRIREPRDPATRGHKPAFR